MGNNIEKVNKAFEFVKWSTLPSELKIRMENITEFIANNYCVVKWDADAPYIVKFISFYHNQCEQYESTFLMEKYCYPTKPVRVKKPLKPIMAPRDGVSESEWLIMKKEFSVKEEAYYENLKKFDGYEMELREFFDNCAFVEECRNKTQYVFDILARELKNHIRYNVSRNDIEWLNGEPVNWEELIDSWICSYISSRKTKFYGKKNVSALKLKFVLTNIQEYNKFYPVQDWATNLQWDGVDRLTKLAEVLGQDTTTTRWRLVLEWFKGSINRFLEPGSKHDIVFIIVGKQGLRKSTFFNDLAYTFGQIQTINDKDSVLQCHQNSLIEIGEIDGLFGRSQNNEMKEFISRQVDVIRPAYGRKALNYPRAFTFAATTNTQTFLNDATGSRRYVVIKVNNVINTDWIKTNRDQIWAQVKCDDSLNLCGYIPSSLVEAHIEENKAFQFVDSETEALLEFNEFLTETDRSKGYIDNQSLRAYMETKKLPMEDYQKLRMSGGVVLLNPINIAGLVFGNDHLFKNVLDKTIFNKINKTFVERLGFTYKQKRVKGKNFKTFTKNVVS